MGSATVPDANSSQAASSTGTVVSLHLHPADEPGAKMLAVGQLTLVEGKGIAEDQRYFSRNSRRQVTLMERERLAEHAAVLGLAEIAPGAARANIETTGVHLRDWLGRDVRVGGAVVRFYAPRTPCHKMDAVAAGLRALMEDGRQGVLATVVSSGVVRMGDAIQVV